MYTLLAKIEDPETGKIIWRYQKREQVIEVTTRIGGSEPTAIEIAAADPSTETFADKQRRMAEERRKNNEAVKRSYRLKPRSN